MKSTLPPFIEIPTWENGIWKKTSFKTRDSYREAIVPLFKIPGEYSFDDTVEIFNEQAGNFKLNGLYCDYLEDSKEFDNYWEDQKSKCRFGLLVKSKNKTWYLPRDYYMWLNFLPINDKVKRKSDFIEVWDGQYHMSLYELLAELHYKHSAVTKKRQFGSSFYHTAKLINTIWFEEECVLKMGASLKDKVNEKGSWKFLQNYRDFLNKNTAWYRPMNPGKLGMWQQQILVEEDNRDSNEGLKGTLQMVTFDKQDTASVGGACTYFFYEEAGIAPKMGEVYEYIRPAMQSGFITTGMFIAAGSVGDLDQCEPLKRLMMFPEDNDIYPVETNLIDGKGTIGKSALFIPEQWSMPPFIDQWGNSLVKEATEALAKQDEDWKKTLDPETYQLRRSQHPRNIEEAFAHRSVSKFPIHLIVAQKRRIENKEYPMEFVDLERNDVGKVIFKQSFKLPIKDFPVPKKLENKEGVVIIYERPPEAPEFRDYFASIDPVNVGKTQSSDSLVSIFIYKNDIEVERRQDGEVKTFIEGGKIVASWCGRFDDPNKNHEQLEMLIELYNAWALVENNVTGFIQYMVNKNKQRYLVTSDQMVTNKDLASTSNVFQKYGWSNRGTIFKEHYLNYVIDFLKEAIWEETKDDGTVVKTTYGVERIPDMMLLKEMEAYQEGMNVDRLVAFAALVTFVKVQQSNLGYKRKIEDLDKDKNKNQPKVNPYEIQKSILKNRNNSGSYRIDRNPFKNIG